MIGQILRFGQEHFPAPVKLTIGRAPADLIFHPRLTRRSDETEECSLLEWWHHFGLCFEKKFFNFNATMGHIEFDSKSPHVLDRKLYPTEYVDYERRFVSTCWTWH